MKQPPLFIAWFTIGFLALTLGGHGWSTQASDWPQWLGPQRDGVYQGKDLSPTFPKNGPTVIWKREVGAGFSAPVIQGDRVILFHRVDDQEVVECLETRNGKTRWKQSYDTAYVDSFGFDEGPRATPLIHEEMVFTFGADGMLLALDLHQGKIVWRIDTQKRFGAQKGFFGLACSPMIEGNALMVNVGGRQGAGIVALDKHNGNVLWKATSEEASYASPTAATINDRRYAFFYNREGLACLNPTTGHVLFQYPWRPGMNASVNAATPLIIGDFIFLSTSYGKGATVLKFAESGPQPVWAKEDALSNHYATSVHHKGYLYGFHGRQEQGCELRCIELQTGKIMWSQDGLKAGTVLRDGSHLWILTEQGQLITAPASPQAFQPSGRAQVLGFSTRAYPALANGRFYGRDKSQLICLDIQLKE